MALKHLARDDEISEDESRSFGEADTQISHPKRVQIPRLLEVSEVGRYFGLRDSSIYRLIRMRILPAVKIGHRVMVSEDDLLAFIRNGGAGLS